MSKIYQTLSVILSLTGLVQFINFVLDNLKIQNSIESSYTLIISVLLSFNIFSLILFYKFNDDITKIRIFLNPKDDYYNQRGNFLSMIKNKKGWELDPSVPLTLLIMMILFIIYLMYKAKLIPFIS